MLLELNRRRIAANLKVKVKCALCFYKPFKDEGKQRKEGNVKQTNQTPPPPSGDTGITGVVTRRFTSRTISSPSKMACVIFFLDVKILSFVPVSYSETTISSFYKILNTVGL